MATVFVECLAGALAWVFLDNHFHVLVKTEQASLSTLMRRVLTGFALRFNQRHERSGYLFQGRFGSRRIKDDADLMNLIRYVHRNPIEAGMVESADALERYRWCGHAALLGLRPPLPFESIEPALDAFSEDREEARRKLREWMNMSDPRGVDRDALAQLVGDVCRELGVSESDLIRGARFPRVSRARSLICRRAIQDLGFGTAEVGRRLRITKGAVSQAVRRAE